MPAPLCSIKPAVNRCGKPGEQHDHASHLDAAIAENVKYQAELLKVGTAGCVVRGLLVG
jgi:hypothetical protein